MDKRFIIIATVDDNSKHASWLGDAQLFDCFLIYCGNDGEKFKREATFYEQIPPANREDKFLVLANVISQYWELLATYEFFWFPDCDIAATPTAINRLFKLCDGHEVALAEPDFDSPSRDVLLSLVDRVNINAPLMSKECLILLHPSLSEAGSTVDLVNHWADKVAKSGGAMATINADGITINKQRVSQERASVLGYYKFHQNEGST